MRLLVVGFTLAGCMDRYGEITIDPTGGPPLGVGLTQHYIVSQNLCEGGVDGDCANSVYPTQLAVAVQTGTAVAVTDVRPYNGSAASFDLEGVAEGSAIVAVTGIDDVTTTFPFDVASVTATTLFVNRTFDTFYGPFFPDVLGPFQAFVGSTTTIDQRSVGADQSLRGGVAPVTLDVGVTGVILDPSCDCYSTGVVTGQAHLSTPLTTVELDVVDATAIADFTDNSTSLTIPLSAKFGSTGVVLLPTDAAGRDIVGHGPDPIVTVADPSIVSAFPNVAGDVRTIDLVNPTVGTTTIDVTWGSIHKKFTIQVSP